MKTMRKRIISLFLAVLPIVSIIPMGTVPASAAALTQSEFDSKLSEAESMHQDWSQQYEWSIDGKVVGWECHGYARWLSWYVWGTDFANGYGDNWSLLKATSSATFINDLSLGDVVRYRSSTANSYNHTIFVTKIVGDTIYYTDCNSDGDNTIRWNRTMLRSTLDRYLKNTLYGSESAPYGYIAHYNLNMLSKQTTVPDAPKNVRTETGRTMFTEKEYITFSWDASEGATDYWVYMWRNGEQIYATDMKLETSHTTAPLPAANYKLIVRAGNSAGYSDVKAEISFIVYNSTPSFSNISCNKSYYNIGEEIQFNTNSDCAPSYSLGIDKYNESSNTYSRVDTPDIINATTLKYSISEAGLYRTYATAYNEFGYIDSPYIYYGVGAFSVQFNSNTDNNESTVKVKYKDTDFVIPEEMTQREGYVFKEWNTKPDCTGFAYYPGGTYTANENLTLYAIWEDISNTIPDGADPNDYEFVTEYRSREKSTTTSASASLDGWTKYKSEITGWTNWSAWQNNSITASESREVKTQYVNPTYKTVWHYSRDTGNGYSTYAIGYYGNPEYITLDYRLTAKGTIDGYTRYGSHGNYLADYWWNESSESVVDRAGYTQYSYRDAVYTHYFYKWSEWSEWSETPIDTTENNDVEIRKVYRLKEDVGTNKPLVDDYSYEVISESPKTCVITGYNGESTDITIPSKIYGYTVTSIRYLAFMKCTSLTSVTIPDSVTSIGNGAFRSCTSLTSITIPDSVMSIGDGAFFNCSSLISITIPDGVTSIGDSAFTCCETLTSIEIPDSVTIIGNSAFFGCESLISIVIPGSVTTIEDYAFCNCENLTIYGYNDSFAQTYAQENDISFNALGDADDDGIIDANDYAMVRSCVMCQSALTEEQRIAADYNRDGAVDAFDAIAIDFYIYTK